MMDYYIIIRYCRSQMKRFLKIQNWGLWLSLVCLTLFSTFMLFSTYKQFPRVNNLEEKNRIIKRRHETEKKKSTEERIVSRDSILTINELRKRKLKSTEKVIVDVQEPQIIPRIFESSSFNKNFWQYNQIAGNTRSYVRNCSNNCLYTEDILMNATFNELHGTVKDPLRNYRYERPHHPKRTHINVTFVTFSHLDPGWGVTEDEYFEMSVRNIFENVFNLLSVHEDLKYIVAEMVFLERWYTEASESNKAQLTKLVKNEQLEIVSGGWCMPDEAVTHYIAVIDQLIEGHTWVKRTFNTTSQYAFANDPFGHSSTMAYLYSKAGMKGFLIHRIHQYQKKYFAENGQQDFLWQQIWDKSGKHNIPTHLLARHDYDLNEQCTALFDSKCFKFDGKVREGFKRAGDYFKLQHPEYENVSVPKTKQEFEVAAQSLVSGYKSLAALYPSDNLLILDGRDFAFSDKYVLGNHSSSYRTLHKIINKNSANYNLSVQQGTLRDYFQSLEHSAQYKKLLNVQGDFFTYSDRQADYWSGFYTTRPFLKYQIRELQRKISAADALLMRLYASRLLSIADLKVFINQLTTARRTLGVLQHHDAITGTSASVTVNDYRRRVKQAIKSTNRLLEKLIRFEHNDSAPHISLNVATHVRNAIYSIKDCDEFYINLFNPTATRRLDLVAVRVPMRCWEQATPGPRIRFQFDPLIKANGKFDYKVMQIILEVKIGAYEQQSLHFVSANCDDVQESIPTLTIGGEAISVPEIFRGGKVSIRNTLPKVTINGSGVSFDYEELSGYFVVTDIATGHRTKLSLGGFQYNLKQGGAYIFKPQNSSSDPVSEPFARKMRVVQGHLRTSLYMVAEVLSIHVHGCHIQSSFCSGLEVSTHTNPYELGRNNKELGMNISTDINNQNIFYSDLNGFQMSLRRQPKGLPKEGRFYPMTSMAFLQDSNRRLNVFSTEPHAIANLQSGDFQVMIDRSLIQNDDKGLGEGVSDSEPVSNSYFILIEMREVKSQTDRNSPLGMQSGEACEINSKLQQPLVTWLLQAEVFNTPLKNSVPHTLEHDVPNHFSFIINRLSIEHGKVQGLLVVHHIAVENSLVNGSTQQLSFQELFPLHGLIVFRTTLGGQTLLERLSPTEDILHLVDTFEIETFRITFI